MHLDRRRFVQGTGAALLAGLAPTPTGVARAAAPFAHPPLPYAEAALAPTISERTVRLHYGVHHAGYFRNLNRLVEGTDFADMGLEDVVRKTAGRAEHSGVFNNAGQAWNHIVYWEQMAPGGPSAPGGDLARMIDRDFGGLADFRAAFLKQATGVFGSGWAWLVLEEGKLALMGTQNADNPLAHGKATLLGIDVWEHAYYLDYESRRGAHVTAVLEKLVNWDVVAGRLAAK